MKKKLTKRNTTDARFLLEQLQNTINHVIKESDLSYSDVFGIIELLKMKLGKNYLSDISEEE